MCSKVDTVLKLSKEEREKLYSPSCWSKRYPANVIVSEHIKYTARETKEAQRSVGHRLDIKYAENPRAKLDIYGEDLPADACIVVYVHGGYWQLLSKDISGYPVKPLYANGILTIIVGYTLAPEAGGLENIVEEVKKAVEWSCSYAHQRGSPAVYLAGHSVGNQIVMQILSTTSPTKGHLGLIRGALNFAGVFDIRPLVGTNISEPLNLTKESAWEFSPQNHVPALAKHWPSLILFIAVGEYDSPEFQRQSQEYSEGCQAAGLEVEYSLIVGADHFNLVEDLSLTDCLITKLMLTFIRRCSQKN